MTPPTTSKDDPASTPPVPLEAGPAVVPSGWRGPYLRTAAAACLPAWAVLLAQLLWWPNRTVTFAALVVAAGWPAWVEHVRVRGTPAQRTLWSRSGGVTGTLLKAAAYLPTLAVTAVLVGNALAKARPVPPEPGTPEHAAALRQAAEAGDPDAAGELADAFKYGRGVAQDPAEAVRWLRRSAEAGVKESQFDLALCMARGEGTAKDDREAVVLFRKAADQGARDAMYVLAVAYANGEGVDRDHAAAVDWCLRAADGGDPRAKRLMAELEPK